MVSRTRKKQAAPKTEHPWWAISRIPRPGELARVQALDAESAIATYIHQQDITDRHHRQRIAARPVRSS